MGPIVPLAVSTIDANGVARKEPRGVNEVIWNSPQKTVCWMGPTERNTSEEKFHVAIRVRTLNLGITPRFV